MCVCVFTRCVSGGERRLIGFLQDYFMGRVCTIAMEWTCLPYSIHCDAVVLRTFVFHLFEERRLEESLHGDLGANILG